MTKNATGMMWVLLDVRVFFLFGIRYDGLKE
ncbi:hypothetical protein H4683_001867 [Filibacter limicola]|uniref:Uncharacterized protein n=1 Tax=Sporosarcina limicola TaxID=34101 RepID=A0A927R6A7_9BACL|nr:hypothetical protein [Sporosarcina limicola]